MKIVLYGQATSVNYNSIFSKTPQTSEFERYGNIPVNLFTGGIDLGIPIFSEKGTNVNLSYNSSGFIPSKKSNYVGYNWNLNYGGVISREVNGVADEYNSDGNGIMGFLYLTKNVSMTNQAAYNNGYTYSYPNGAVVNVNGYLTEVRPDKFNFNFCGISGYFYIGNDGNPVISSNTPNLKIKLDRLNYQYSYNGCEPDVSGFTITDGEGNEYYFGDNVENMEISYYLGHHLNPSGAQAQLVTNPSYNISAWYLYKIKFSNKEELKISYKKRPLLYPAQFTFCTRWNTLPLKNQFTNGSQQFYDILLNSNQTNYFYNYSYYVQNGDTYTGSGSGYSIEPPHYIINATKKVYPESMEYLGRFLINFKYSTQTANTTENFNTYLLDSIIVKTPSQPIDKFKFTYDVSNRDYYFLKTITKNNIEKYTLDYSNTGSLPKFSTFGTDYWGYWNGGNETANQIIPTYKINISNGDLSITGTSREPNTGLYGTAQLSKITYPTGGYSTFEYEPHYYSKKVAKNSSTNYLKQLISAEGYVGGARIKKIVSFDGSNSITKEYKYIKDYSSGSSGTASSGILYNDYRMVDFIDGAYQTNQSSSSSKRITENASNIDNKSLSSYNIAYSEVSELENNELKKKYYFSDYSTNPDSLVYKSQQNPYNYTSVNPYNYQKNFGLVYLVKNNERGKLIKEQSYKNGTDLVLQTTNLYGSLKTHPLLASNYVTGADQSVSWVNIYKFYGLPYVLLKSATQKYLSPSTIESSTEYSYGNNVHLNVTLQKDIFPEGKRIETTYKYAFEKSNQKLIDSNRVNIPLEISVTKKKDISDVGKITSRIETIYPDQSNYPTLAAGNLILPLSTKTYDILNSGAAYEEVTYDKYDSKGNLQQYTKDGVPVAIIWGYSDTQPIAKIEGAKITDIQQSLITNIVNASNTDASAAANNDETSFLTTLDVFRKDSSLAGYQITTYTYDPLIGVRSITPPSGIREYYQYDSANRLEKVIDSDKKVLKEFKYNYKN